MIRLVRDCSLRRKEAPGNGNVGGTAEVISSQICRDMYLGLFMWDAKMSLNHEERKGQTENERKTGKNQGGGIAEDF